MGYGSAKLPKAAFPYALTIHVIGKDFPWVVLGVVWLVGWCVESVYVLLAAA